MSKMLRSVRTVVRSSVDRIIEKALNIDTMIPETSIKCRQTSFQDSQRYESVNYLGWWQILNSIGVKQDDVIFDIGAGAGRVLCLLARFSVQRCVGVECVPELAEQAKLNALSLRGRKSPIEIYCEDATRADYAKGTVYLFFNPFGPQTLREVLQEIKKSLDANSRHIRIVYINPTQEIVLEECEWLSKEGQRTFMFSNQRVSYWTNIKS